MLVSVFLSSTAGLVCFHIFALGFVPWILLGQLFDMTLCSVDAFIPWTSFYIDGEICAKLQINIKKPKTCDVHLYKSFCTKLRLVWINGHNLIYSLHLTSLKVPHGEGAWWLLPSSSHFSYNNFNGSRPISMSIEVTLSFSSSLFKCGGAYSFSC